MMRHDAKSRVGTPPRVPKPAKFFVTGARHVASIRDGIQTAWFFWIARSRTLTRDRHLWRRNGILQSLGQHRRRGCHAIGRYLPRRRRKSFDTANVYSRGLSEEILGK